MMSAEKVALYRQRFRGRDDVYPKLWTNTTTGRTGYAPACANEWVRGICEKPRVKCGACLNQAFLPVTDQIILDHLQGRHVVGIYPLLTEETCWLLAADFDTSSWADDVPAFAETCRTAGVPAAVERSRSGLDDSFADKSQVIRVRRVRDAIGIREKGCALLPEELISEIPVPQDFSDVLVF